MKKRCSKCNKIKDLNLFYKHEKYKDGYRNQCIECFKKSKAEYQKKNDKKFKKYLKIYNKKNRKRLNKLRTNYYTNRYKNDILYKLIRITRGRVSKALKSKSWRKVSLTIEYLGCSVPQFKKHIEKQFKPGMTWKNHGLRGWHIDHIIPINSAKTKEDLYKLCNYKNLQPLWAKENFLKSDKI